MRNIIFLLACIPIMAMGQQIEVLSSSTQSIKAQIDLAKGEISEVTSVDGIQLSLENGELSIRYRLADLGSDGRFYEVIPTIKLDGEELFLMPNEELRGDWKQPQSPGEKQMRWVNLQERFIQLEGQIEVALAVDRWGERKLPYDCSLGEPQFTSKQRLPYFLAAGVGAASIGIGQILRSQSQDLYDNEYLTASSFAEADPIYQDANSKHQTYLILTYVGASILVADATLYLIRQRKYKKNKTYYDQFCGESTAALRSSFDLSTGLVQGGLGLKMKLTF